MDKIRQNKIGRLLQQAMSQIFLMEAQSIISPALVTISDVHVTPDLSLARFYLSIYNVENPDEILSQIENHHNQFRYWLGNHVKNQVRKIPQIEFFRDESLDNVFELEKIFKELKENSETKKQ